MNRGYLATVKNVKRMDIVMLWYQPSVKDPVRTHEVYRSWRRLAPQYRAPYVFVKKYFLNDMASLHP